MSTPAHTPTPWHVSHQLADGYSIAHEVAPNCGHLIPLAIAHDSGRYFGGYGLTPEIGLANARFIVRACNSHEKLVAALEDVAGLADRASQLATKADGCLFRSIADLARRHIALAAAQN